MTDGTAKPDTILVLDFGGQYAHLIARRIREMKVFSEVLHCDLTMHELKSKKSQMKIRGIILSGGPSSVYDETAPTFNIEVMKAGMPLLGICYGHQLIAKQVGGKVIPSKKNEYGIIFVTIDKSTGVLNGLEKTEKVWMSHGDTVLELPEEFQILAHSDSSPVAAFRHENLRIYGLQWHPEVVHTEKGNMMLRNFVFDTCECKPNWIVDDYLDNAIKEVKKEVGEGNAIVALSGGVDSSVAAAIASRAIRKKLTAVLIDHGFLRYGEVEEVKTIFAKFESNLIVLDRKENFLKRLVGIVDPERKRKIIGEEFIRSFESISKDLKADYLIQGTIYPDRIESGFKKHSDKIKTHHNVGGLPDTTSFKAIVEPIKDLYKDEVRVMAKRLNLPKKIWGRQPFPGPGLAVRIIGEIDSKKPEILKKADRIVTEEIEKANLEDKLWQYFAILTDSKSTGVKGDARAYGYTIAIRAVESIDGMTANFAKLNYDLLETISSRLTNEVPEVVRVVYDITHKPPATIEW
ncbi:MAG: glutamine-hydrolyzing GMP synthase, partial [Candidatus Bathyarchaeota archaeon]|nr:glutamine-hydrolyzing GMP synthase [Candidatus Bathyarchaeota archaeon]